MYDRHDIIIEKNCVTYIFGNVGRCFETSIPFIRQEWKITTSIPFIKWKITIQNCNIIIQIQFGFEIKNKINVNDEGNGSLETSTHSQ